MASLNRMPVFLTSKGFLFGAASDEVLPGIEHALAAEFPITACVIRGLCRTLLGTVDKNALMENLKS